VYEHTIDQPNSPKGEPLQIVGLGTFENGYTYTINRYEAESFRDFHQSLVPVMAEDDKSIIGQERQQGPTLLEAAKGMYGVTVTSFDKDQDSDPNARNAKRATTTFSRDTSEPNPGTALSEAQNPELDKGGTDAQPKVKADTKQPAKTSSSTKSVGATSSDKGGDS
jgi:hypothetical protein